VSTFGRLYRGETHIDFVGNRRRGFTFSGVIVAIALLSMIFSGFNFSVDFEGGTVLEFENPAGADIGEIRDALESADVEGAKVQLIGGGDGIRVQSEQLPVAQENEAVAAVAAIAGVDPSEASRETVSPTFGSQVAESALRALIIFLIVVAIYISIRLEWKMALAGMLALAHDLVFTAGIYSLSGFEVSP
jgi:preprotein translocase subunit SecF